MGIGPSGQVFFFIAPSTVVPPFLPLALFALTYLGLALGRLPGLRLDRTGFAMLGAMAFLASGLVSLEQAKTAVDAPTLAILFGLMLLSAQYQQSGLYDRIGSWLVTATSPRSLMVGTVVIGGLLSAVLTNDVTCFALTPLLASALLGSRPDGSRLDPVPFLVALACASNIGSALTPIGNPQNILIASRLRTEFLPFVIACAPAVAASLVALAWLATRQIRQLSAIGTTSRNSGPSPAAATLAPAELTTPEVSAVDQAMVRRHPLDRGGALKAVLLTVVTVVLFMTTVPMHLTALAAGGIVLTSRSMHTREALALVDWHLLALFVALFTVTHGLELSGWTEYAARALAATGADLAQPALLAAVVTVLGNLVGNVPAVMLLLPFLPTDNTVAYTLALASTFAGNLVLVGSVANLIVASQAARLGIHLGLREHLRLGLPITLISLVIAGLSTITW